MILSEKKLRQIIREEFERFMGKPEPSLEGDRHVLSIKGANGGEIIMPNPIKEKFDEGRVQSLKDIL